MNSKQVGSAIGAGFAVFCVIAAGAATILTSTTSIDANSLTRLIHQKCPEGLAGVA